MKSKPIIFYLNANEKVKIKKRAEAEGCVSMSEWIRRVLYKELNSH
ncbi:MAG: hypothetical protein ABIG39_03410 [Candidatus Micrarchaeota archaeon]